mgnify:CR=1 FL=1
MKPLFFVHVPKTAGTSFRHGIEAYFGSSKIVYDYGPGAAQTSPPTRELVHAPVPDLWTFYRRCLALDARLLAGHVPVSKYVSLCGASQTVTFLREPLQRAASEYSHFQRLFNYKGSFRDFIGMPLQNNRQSAIMQGTDIEAMGVVGLTERYQESLELINARYGLAIQQREDNRAKSAVGASHDISAEDEAEFRSLNALDITLYERCRQLFETRLQLYRDDLPYAHAKLTQFATHQVSGWAFWEGEDDAPVIVEVWVNGDLRGTVSAVHARPNMYRLQPPRGGYVGFSLTTPLSVGDEVQCRVVDTGQWFPFKPRRVSAPSAA